ncbi:MAG: S1 RNA-binding domain-containing protein [Flavobacteriales bacterium]
MIPLGKTIPLTLSRFTKQGAYLISTEGEEVLLPQKYLAPSWSEGMEIQVYVVKDSLDRRVALTQPPNLSLNEFAVLPIVEINPMGAFADWGIDRDLFIPFAEQRSEVEIGKHYPISLKYDELTDRLYGTMKTNKHVTEAPESITGSNLPFLVTENHTLGWKGIVDNQYSGMLYASECSLTLSIGDVINTFVSLVRPDGKVDVKLSPEGFKKYDDAADQLWNILQNQKFLYLHDKSPADEIYKALSMSKKTFKQAVGKLYKEKKIALFKDKIARIDA